MDNNHETTAQNGATMISHTMLAPDIVTHLVDHGCSNITDQLDLSSSSQFPIANGGYGDVYRAQLKDQTLVAIKTMRLQIDSTDEGTKYLKRAARELHTWAKCDHPNVLELLGLAVFRDQIGMISPWMENGSLPSYLAKNPNTDRLSICSQISNGLEYLHRCGIIHGDLKGLNIFVSNEGNAVLADFGNATLKDQTLLFTTTTDNKGISHRWAAPELFQGEATHTTKSDIYALGMTILETVTGSVPYSKKSDFGVMFAVVMSKEAPERPKDTIHLNNERGDPLWALLLSCWLFEPKERPSAASVANIMRELIKPGGSTLPHSATDTSVSQHDRPRRASSKSRFMLKDGKDYKSSGDLTEDGDHSSVSDIPGDIDFDFVYSSHAFIAAVEGQANVAKGDSLFLMDDSHSDWWLVRVLKRQEIGYIPAEIVETPFERLARLNKHRNVDLASPTQQERMEDTLWEAIWNSDESQEEDGRDEDEKELTFVLKD